MNKLNQLLQTITESVLKHTADQTIYKNPTQKEMMSAFKNSSRGTMVWDMTQSGDWFLSHDDVTHQTLLNEIPIRHDTINFYMDPIYKVLSLGYNRVDFRKEEARGSYIPYKQINEDPYWNILQDSGWELKDISGWFDSDGLQERIKEHPLDVKQREMREYYKKESLKKIQGSDKELLKKLGL